ncbi:MAG: GNAT family protein [Anaerolineae bacterium]
MAADFIIRPVRADDAEQMLAIMRSVADEPHNGILYSRMDALRSVEEQRRVIEQRMAAPNCTILAAEVEGRMVGYVSCSGGLITATQHTVGLGITIEKAWRDQGIGTALMRRAVEWAHSNPMVKRLELDVMTYNPRAQHIYEKVGFQAEGIKRQVYFKDGQFVDALIMAIVFER